MNDYVLRPVIVPIASVSVTRTRRSSEVGPPTATEETVSLKDVTSVIVWLV